MTEEVKLTMVDGEPVEMDNDKKETKVGGIAQEKLQHIVERIEHLESEKNDLAGLIKDTYDNAKSQGFDAKVLRQIIALRKKDPAEVQEQENLLDVYRHALGM